MDTLAKRDDKIIYMKVLKAWRVHQRFSSTALNGVGEGGSKWKKMYFLCSDFYPTCSYN